MAAASPWEAVRAAEWAPESTSAEEETWIPVGTAAAGPRGACMSSVYRPRHPTGCSRHYLGGLLHCSTVVAWLHVILGVTSVKVASTLE